MKIKEKKIGKEEKDHISFFKIKEQHDKKGNRKKEKKTREKKKKEEKNKK